MVVIAKISMGHINELGSVGCKFFEISDGETMIVAKMRIKFLDILLEHGEHCRDLAIPETWNILPRLAFRSCIAMSPTDGISYAEASVLCKFFNIVKESIKF